MSTYSPSAIMALGEQIMDIKLPFYADVQLKMADIEFNRNAMANNKIQRYETVLARLIPVKYDPQVKPVLENFIKVYVQNDQLSSNCFASSDSLDMLKLLRQQNLALQAQQRQI